MTKINKEFKVKKAERINEYYDPSKALPNRYTVTKGDFQLYHLDILCGYSDSDHPEDTFWITEKHQNFMHIFFWAKPTEDMNEAFFTLIINFINFIDVLNNNKDNIDFSYIKKVIKSPEKYTQHCQDWIFLISPKSINIQGTIIESLNQIVDFEYKFRKMCELVERLTAFSGIETMYNDFQKIKKIGNF